MSTITIPNNVARVTVFAMIVGLAGCATHRDIEMLREEVRHTTEASERAAANADAAQQEAAEASQAAREAKMMANDASTTAREAKSASEQTDAKINRMFKKAMHK